MGAPSSAGSCNPTVFSTIRGIHSIGSRADSQVHASHGGVAHILDCPLISGHRSFVRIDYNDGSGYQVSYEHIHNVDLQISEGQQVARGQYLGNISADSNCGGSATGYHTHMSLWHFTGAFTKASSQAVDLSGVQVGSWLVDDGSPTQEQYIGCVTPVSGGTRQCPQTTINNDLSVGTPCTTVTASATPISPQAAGTSITVTAVGTCPSANPQYEFWALWSGTSSWILQQAYSTATTWTWNSTGAPAGTEQFWVWALDANSVGNSCNAAGSCYDTYASIIPYTVQVFPCSSAGVSASPRSPAPASTIVVITGRSSGCPNPQYEFWALWQGTTTWVLQQTYSIYPSYVWDSTGAPAGVERFGVWVKDASSPNPYDQVASIPYTITNAPCTVLGLTAAPASPSVHGTTITVTATSTCPNPNPQYEFWALWAGTSSWILQQAYSTATTWTWNSTGAPAGVERFGVWVKDVSEPASVQADLYFSIPYQVT
jgi:hypothetical protein